MTAELLPRSSPDHAIANADEAAHVIARLASLKTLALDTEGDGMFRYRARLCTVQLAGGSDLCVIDTLAFDAVPLLRELLSERGPEKIVHDLSFDARVLYAHGIVLGRVFDTSIAARFLGLKNTGLSSLLSSWFELNLPKHKQQSDWGERPLDEEARRYLADDVRYLAELRDRLLLLVRAQGIEDEVREECAYMLGEATRASKVASPWTRFKGAALRRPIERARLYELAQAREELARELDVPPARLVANELLLRIAELDNMSEQELLSRLPTRADPYLASFLEALQRAKERGDAPEAEVQALLPRPPSPFEIERKKRRRRVLSDFRAREAELRNVDAQVILPGHCLAEITDLDVLNERTLSEVPGFGACRIERYAAKLTAELAEGW